jgi:hypothetical protein
MGLVGGNQPCSDNDWEKLTKGGDEAIKKWINEQLKGRSCAIVLIGQNTAGRKWINYEISAAWNEGMGVVGVYVHRLKDLDAQQSRMGSNPFDHLTFKSSGKKLSTIVRAHNPLHTDSKDVYAYIKKHLPNWIEEAIEVRNNH